MFKAVEASGGVREITQRDQTVLQYVTRCGLASLRGGGVGRRGRAQQMHGQRLHGIVVDQGLFVLTADRQDLEEPRGVQQQLLVVGLTHQESNKHLSAAQLQYNLFCFLVAERKQLQAIDHNRKKFDIRILVE